MNVQVFLQGLSTPFGIGSLYALASGAALYLSPYAHDLQTSPDSNN